MSVKMKFGSKDIPFVYKGDKLVYPNPIKDGLLLWYDFKGMRNTDTNKEVAKDLSGNGNDGTLTNFNFTEGSGYKDNTLVFDGVDDSLTIPELALDETAMSVVHDGEIYSYEDDKVLTFGEDGEIISEKINLLSSTSHTMKKTLNMGWGNSYGSFIAKPLETYTVKVYVKPTTSSTSAQIIFRGSDGLNIKESGAGNWIRPGEEGYVTRTYQAPEGTVSAWIQIRNGERLDSGAVLEYKELQVFEGSHSKFYSPNPKDYKTTTLSPTSLTELQLYNKTLSKDEFLHNAESKGLKKLKPGVVAQDGLVLHYDFSHESNTSEYKDKAFDYSGNGNHGELRNFNFTEESGYEGEGLKFDGVDDSVIIQAQKNWVNQSEITAEIVFISSSKSNITLLSNDYRNFEIALQSSGGVQAYYSNGDGANYRQPAVAGNYNDGKIHCITIVFLKAEDTVIFYDSGREIHRQTRFDPSDMTGGLITSFNLGSRPPNKSRIFTGEIFSARIYNKKLTPEEIAHNYAIEKEKFNIIEGDV